MWYDLEVDGDLIVDTIAAAPRNQSDVRFASARTTRRRDRTEPRSTGERVADK